MVECSDDGPARATDARSGILGGDPFAVGNGHFEGRARSERRPRAARHPDRAAGAANAQRREPVAASITRRTRLAPQVRSLARKSERKLSTQLFIAAAARTARVASACLFVDWLVIPLGLYNARCRLVARSVIAWATRGGFRHIQTCQDNW